MFELPPFRDCPACNGADQLGILSVGSDAIVLRCRACRFSNEEPLPALTKKVLYLDQNALSEVFKTKTRTRRAGAPHEAFWASVTEKVHRLVSLQQIVCAESDIHRDETLVFSKPDDLRIALEMLGDVSLKDHRSVQRMQVRAFASSYLSTGARPSLTFDIQDILDSELNRWLPRFHITIGSALTHFAPQLRADRETQGRLLQALIDRWVKDRPSFPDVLRFELDEFSRSHIREIQAAIRRQEEGRARGEWTLVASGVHHSSFQMLIELEGLFSEAGVPEENLTFEAMKFLQWSENDHIPENRISSYLFAALARRAASGQRRFSTGIINDVRAISAYAPYVDAMFLDKECATLLSEPPLRDDLSYKARVFSLHSADEFLSYLDDLERQTPAPIAAAASIAYGLIS